MKARFVYENLDFERGQDPKKAMGLGYPDLEQISKNATRFGFRRIKTEPGDIITWEKPGIGKVHYSTWPETNNYMIASESSNQDWDHWETEEWRYAAQWYQIFGPSILDESINFRRNQNPKKSMGVGLLNTDVTDYSEEELRQYFIQILPILFPDHKDNNYKDLLPIEKYEYLNAETANILGEFWLDKQLKQGSPKVDFNVYEVIRDYITELKESLNFERGKEPKESLGIGKVANRIKIASMDEEQWEGGRVASLDDLKKANGNTWSNPIDDEDFVKYVLSNWEEEIDPFYGFWAWDGEEDTSPEYMHPSELEGEYVEYGGDVYQIPETDLFKNTSQKPA